MPEYRLTDEHGIDRGVIEETSSKDSGDPAFNLFEVYVRAGSADPDGQRRKRAAELAAPLLEISAEDWLYLRYIHPDLIARLRAALFPAGGER